MKTPEIKAMYPERKLFAIGWVKPNVSRVPNGPKFRLNYVTGKNVRTQSAKRLENTRLLLILPAPKPTDSTLKTQQKNPSCNCRHSSRIQADMENLDRELAYYLWPGDADAGNIDGSILRWAKNEVIARDREDWSHLRINGANNLMRFATAARLFLALSVNVRSTFTKTLCTEQIHY